MTVEDLLGLLRAEPNQKKLLTATFSNMCKTQNVVIFAPNEYEYLELFVDDLKFEDAEPCEDLTYAEAIKELEEVEYPEETDIILTLGNEEDDTCSTMGGVEWKNGEFYVNTKTCPRQV
jgi:hypothetical protein